MNYKLFEMTMQAESLERQINELSMQTKQYILKVEKGIIDSAKSQSAQATQPQGSSAQPTVGDPKPESPPLTTQEVYEIAQNPQQWSQFLEAKKPELEAGWSRRSA